MPIPAEYRPWIDLALAIAGVRKTGKVSRTCWLYPLIKQVAEESAAAERRKRQSLIS